MKLLSLLMAGVLFGAGLALSGMTDPSRVVGFLDVTGSWDPSLAFVMAGALAVFAIGLRLWRWRKGAHAWFGKPLPERNRDPVDTRLVVGAVIFGIGWGLGGFCPGPAIANLGALRTASFVFLPAMAVGVLVARFGFGAE